MRRRIICRRISCVGLERRQFARGERRQLRGDADQAPDDPLDGIHRQCRWSTRRQHQHDLCGEKSGRRLSSRERQSQSCSALLCRRRPRPKACPSIHSRRTIHMPRDEAATSNPVRGKVCVKSADKPMVSARLRISTRGPTRFPDRELSAGRWNKCAASSARC
jgi:hypothetical protein